MWHDDGVAARRASIHLYTHIALVEHYLEHRRVARLDVLKAVRADAQGWLRR